MARPRDPKLDQAILDAALDVLLSVGYAGLTMEGVAQRAGAPKTALYRRWSSKLDLVLAAIDRGAEERLPVPRTGDVRVDYQTLLATVAEELRGLRGQVASAVLAEVWRHPEFHDAVSTRIRHGRLGEAREIVDAGIEAGQLPPDADSELLAEVGIALLEYRLLIQDRAATPDLPERILQQFLPVHQNSRPGGPNDRHEPSGWQQITG